MKKETLKDLRERAGLTQELAAWKLKICKNYLSLLENGKRNPSDKLKYRMAKLYKVSIDEFFIAIQTTKCQMKKRGD